MLSARLHASWLAFWLALVFLVWLLSDEIRMRRKERELERRLDAMTSRRAD